MASLRETKDRIGSVKSTLKITSAMKLVASSKLRRAQNAIESLRPYEESLQSILRETSKFARKAEAPSDSAEVRSEEQEQPGKLAIVAVASNSSLCGAFNSNVIRKVLELTSRTPDATVFCIGRKMADALKKAGFPSPGDYSGLVAKPSYGEAGQLAEALCDGYAEGRFSAVVLVYNHFVSASRQEVRVENYLPFDDDDCNPEADGNEEHYIFEPGADAIKSELLPKLIRLKLFAAVLDSAAAEHAARIVAMQTATDNARELLSDLTLEYNKGRQQKITAEILELVGGQQ